MNHEPIITIENPAGGLPALLTVPEACEVLRIGKSLLYAMIRAGRIRTIKLGSRSTRVPRSELLPLLEAERQEAL